ncbi:MAG TPA: hypothetical protein PKX15_09670 [Bacteroidales bacterium]|nr:hypothetical protein [Bacteroidales bacterium]
MNKVAFVMSLWKRQKLFSNIIDDLNKQTYKNFDLFCWNNNADPEAIELVEVQKNNTNGYKLITTPPPHYITNLRGFSRFIFCRKILLEEVPEIEGIKYDKAIFADDDQRFEPQFVEYMVQNFEPKSYKSSWGWKINTNYWDRTKALTGEDADYAGTCGAIIDISIFNNTDFFDSYNYEEDVYCLEDLALSLYCKKIGWKVEGITRKYIHSNPPDGYDHYLMTNIINGVPISTR